MSQPAIRIALLRTANKQHLSPLQVEAWNSAQIVGIPIASGLTNEYGHCELVICDPLQPKLFAESQPIVFFRIFDRGKLILDTRGSVTCELKPGVNEVIIRLPDSDEFPPHTKTPIQPIKGRAVLVAGWDSGLSIEVFADAELTQPIGSATIEKCGKFHVTPKKPISHIWFRWSQNKHQGRSPRLQPFSADSPVRLHIYRPWSGPAKAGATFHAHVRSTSGRAAVGMPVVLVEVTLQRCQVLGQSVTDDQGAAVISYDPSSLFMDRPDLRVIVLDPNGTPLIESQSGSVDLPGTVARTITHFTKTQQAFDDEHLGRDCHLTLDDADVRYLAERTGLPSKSVAAYSAAASLAPKLKVPTEALFALTDSQAPDVHAALEQAVARDLISPELLAQSKELVPRLEAAASQASAHEDLGRGSLDAFLATQVTDAVTRAQLARIILDNGRLSAVREQLEKEQLAAPPVHFLLDLQAIAGVDVGLAKALGRRFSEKQLADGQDLALLGTGDWQSLLKESHTDETGLRARATALKQRAQNIFPEEVFRAQLSRAGEAPWAARIRSYFEKHPDRTFKSPLPLPDKEASADDAAELAALTAYKRLVRLTRDHTVVGALLDAGFTSASDLAAIGREELIARFGSVFEGDTDVIAETHDRALRTAAALNIASSFLPVGPRPSLCDCADCKTIFGPAAYLFELLALFRRYTTGPENGSRSLLSHLEERRPDLTRTHLSCPNTTIEVPQVDLVNEVLEDLILASRGTSVVHNLAPGECLPENRQSQGTSEERRATPQNPPSAELVDLLAEAAFPWTLPYDYERDRARSARDRLFDRPDAVALEVWRSTVAADATSLDEATRALSATVLDLNDAERRLITEGAPLESAWGTEVAVAVASDGPQLALLTQVTATDYATLEAVLDTAFVRGTRGSELAIVPADFCTTGQPPRLTGPADALTEVLDRFHRFERLRRHLGWTVRDLDEALRWLDGALDANGLHQIGILRFLERRLQLAPGRLLTLFRDPDASRQPTLRPHLQTSAFDAQFATGSSSFQLPEASLDEHERSESVTAQIARASGESLATVDRTFEAGLVAPFKSGGDLLPLAPADAQAAYRRAVAASYREATWAERLRLDEAALQHLVAVGGLQFLATTQPAADRLRDALRLADLADQSADWPVKISELRYLIGGDPACEREHGLSATQVGALLLELRRELELAQQAAKPLPEDPRAALRALLSRLLMAARSENRTITDTDILSGELADALEWGAFFPARAVEADASLSNTLTEWPALVTLPSHDPAELSGALDLLKEPLPDWLGQAPGAPATWPAPELDAVTARLQSVTRAVLADPSFDAVASLQPDLQALFSAARVTPPDGFAGRIITLAIDQVATALEDQLTERAASIVPIAEAAWRCLQARQVLLDWIARGFAGASPAIAATIVDYLSDPPGQPIARAFVDAAGLVSPRLAASAVSASYFAIAGGTVNGSALEKRIESTLVFDWSARPPTSALKDRPFTAELAVRLPSSHFVNDDGSPVSLVVEADGDVEIIVEDADATRSLLHETPGLQVRRFDVSIGSLTDPEVTLRIRYRTPDAGGARVLKLLQRASDGVLDEFQWAVLAPLVRRMRRAVLALRGIALPPTIWTALTPMPGRSRAVDLDHLTGGASLTDWLAFFALGSLVKRIRAASASAALVRFLAGGETTHADLLQVLNVDDSELDGALQLFGVSAAADDPVTLPSTVTFAQMKAALGLVDRARQLNLSVTALARWSQASPHEIYQSALAALRVGLEPSEWLKLLAEVQDPVREHLRDAQIDYLVGQRREGTDLSSREAISEYLLTDVQMSACMTTSRIQFAYAAVQRYVEAAQGGRAPWLPTDKQGGFAREWVSLKQYRLYEAQMRIVVHTENWIDPAIRPTKTPAFERLEQAMTSGPLTLSLAEDAVKEYAASLAEIARLEPVAIVTHDAVDSDRPLAFRDSELPGTHVFARTRAHPQRLYYRRRLPQPDGRWTPWERIDTDLEGTHYLALVAFGRLRLICADFSVARSVRNDDCDQHNTTNHSGKRVGQPALTDYEVTLSWIDREHGRWSPLRRSSRFPFSITIESPRPEDVYNKALPEHFGIIQRDADLVLQGVEVQVDFDPGRWTMHQGSQLKVSLLHNGGSYEIGSLQGKNPPQTTDKVTLRKDQLPNDFDVEAQTRLRLEWNPVDENVVLVTDDCKVRNIVVRFPYLQNGSPAIPYETEISFPGTMWQQPDPAAQQQPVNAFPITFWGGGTPATEDLPTFGATEPAWKMFEADLNILALVADHRNLAT